MNTKGALASFAACVITALLLVGVFVLANALFPHKEPPDKELTPEQREQLWEEALDGGDGRHRVLDFTDGGSNV